jgi:hypothetical protein
MSKSSELDKAVKLYLLECIEGDIETTKDRFTSEYGWRIDRIGKIRSIAEWLQGLALNIAFYNHDIIELAKAWGSIPEDATEKQKQKILDNYWIFMANKLHQLFEGYRVPKEEK